MKLRLYTIAMVGGLTATSAVGAQGYTVMGGGAQASPGAPVAVVAPPSPNVTAVVAPAQSTRVEVTPQGRRPEEYGGVTPGLPALPPGFRRARRPTGAPLVAWPGFQMVPGGSRLFVVLTSAQPVGEAQRAGRTRVFHIAGSRILLSNNRRPLITEAFNTPVARAFLRPARGGTDLVVELRADVEPTLAQETNAQGYHFVFLNFPSFQAPEIARIVLPSGVTVSATPQGPAVGATPTVVVVPGAPPPAVVVGTPRPAGPGADAERPPGVH